jgi:hypothetical protein
MAVEIRETKIATDGAGTIVELHIADAPIDESGATFRLTLLATLPHSRSPFVSQVQREAILEARDALGKIADALLQTLPHGAHARPEVI